MNRTNARSMIGRRPRFVEGDVLDYQLWDEQGKPVERDLTRNQARELKSLCGGVIVKVVVVH
jgi:hypothetical protein